MELMETYYNANEAFEYFYKTISKHGIKFADTKALFNIGFTIHKPMLNNIITEKRKWSKEYAEAEWQWYLSGDRNIKKLGDIYGKIPPIWERMADHNGNVNSNYGWQWLRNDQYEYIIDKLKFENDTRHAAISIYDCKENLDYENDTPCTYAVQFTIINDRLCMSVYMRSNDLWYGFCNDQYCFSMLQKKVAEDVNKEIGWYYHHAHNMHLYNDKL